MNDIGLNRNTVLSISAFAVLLWMPSASSAGFMHAHAQISPTFGGLYTYQGEATYGYLGGNTKLLFERSSSDLYSEMITKVNNPPAAGGQVVNGIARAGIADDGSLALGVFSLKSSSTPNSTDIHALASWRDRISIYRNGLPYPTSIYIRVAVEGTLRASASGYLAGANSGLIIQASRYSTRARFDLSKHGLEDELRYSSSGFETLEVQELNASEVFINGTVLLPVSPSNIASVELVTWTGGNRTATSDFLQTATIQDVILPEGIGYTFESGIVATSDLNSPVPEPTSLALLGIGIAGIISYGYRRKRNGFLGHAV